jgi:hypothetical protein
MPSRLRDFNPGVRRLSAREAAAFSLFVKGAPLEVLAHCLGCTAEDADVWTTDPIGFAGTFRGHIPSNVPVIPRRRRLDSETDR